MNGYEMLDLLENIMGAEELLHELMQALSEKEARENAEYIARMHDLTEETVHPMLIAG